MNDRNNVALRLVPMSDSVQRMTKPVKKRDFSPIMKVRRTMREDAAFLRTTAKCIMILGLAGEAVLGYLNNIAMDYCESALAGSPIAETFGWISLAVCLIAFIIGIVNCGIAFVLFTIASSISESAKDLLTEVK